VRPTARWSSSPTTSGCWSTSFPTACTCSTAARSSSRATRTWRWSSKRTVMPASSARRPEAGGERMNIHAVPQLTPAETALVDAFGERLSLLPGDGAVMVKRDDAIEQVKTGLPTKRVESWHYTDLRRLLTSVPAFDETAKAEAVAPVLEGSAVFSVLNGRSSEKTAKVEGVTVTRVADKLTDGSFAPALEPRGSDDAVGALNTAFVADGYFLDIAEGVELSQPIELQNVQAGGQTHVRLPVRVGNGAKAVIVERQTGTGDAFVSSVANVTVGDGAELTWLIVQEQ